MIRYLHLSDLHLTSSDEKGPVEAFKQDDESAYRVIRGGSWAGEAVGAAGAAPSPVHSIPYRMKNKKRA